ASKPATAPGNSASAGARRSSSPRWRRGARPTSSARLARWPPRTTRGGPASIRAWRNSALPTSTGLRSAHRTGSKRRWTGATDNPAHHRVRHRYPRAGITAGAVPRWRSRLQTEPGGHAHGHGTDRALLIAIRQVRGFERTGRESGPDSVFQREGARVQFQDELRRGAGRRAAVRTVGAPDIESGTGAEGEAGAAQVAD